MPIRELQTINSSGELTEIKLNDTAAGSRLLTSDEINQLISDTNISSHLTDLDNPHQVTATQLGLGNIDNTADLDKPISTATQTVLDDVLYSTGTKQMHSLSTTPAITGTIYPIDGTTVSAGVYGLTVIGSDIRAEFPIGTYITIRDNATTILGYRVVIGNYYDAGQNQIYYKGVITGTIYDFAEVDGFNYEPNVDYDVVTKKYVVDSIGTATTDVYVPYTGANTDVNLGANNLSTTGNVYGTNPAGTAGVFANNLTFSNNSDPSLYGGVVRGSAVAGGHIVNIPDAAGTLALLSDITGTNSGTNTGDQDLSVLVPYTGATGDVNIGEHFISYGGAKYHAYTYLEILALVSPVEGMMVWNTTTKKFNQYNGSLWQEMTSGAGGGTVTSVAISGSDGIEVDSGSPITSAGTIALGINKTTLLAHINVADGADVGTVTSITSSTTDQLTVATGTTTPALSIITGAVASASNALVTADSIYDFIMGLYWEPTYSNLYAVARSGLAIGTIDTWVPITGLTKGLNNNITQGTAGFTIIDYGVYDIHINGSFEYTVTGAGTTSEVNIAVFLDGAEQTNLEVKASSTDGVNIAFSIGGLLDLYTDAVISFAVKSTEIGTFGISYGGVVINKIGPANLPA